MGNLGSTFVNGELDLSGRLGGMSTRAPIMYDDFDAVDGTKIIGRTAPTGQVWEGYAPGSQLCHVTNGRMFSNTGNSYMYLPTASPVTRQACTFSFTPATNFLTVVGGTPHVGDVLQLDITPSGGTKTTIISPMPSSDRTAGANALSAQVNSDPYLASQGISADYSYDGSFAIQSLAAIAPKVEASVSPGATTTLTVGPATSSGDRTSNAVVMLTLPAPFSLGGKMLHLQVYPDGWEFATSTTGGSGLVSGSVRSAFWNVPLTTDGTVYQVAIEVDWVNHAITILGPDGSINRLIDDRVHNMQPLTVASPSIGDTIQLKITPSGGVLTVLPYTVTSTDVGKIAQDLVAAVNNARTTITDVANGVTAEYSTGGVFNLFWFGSNAPTVTKSTTGTTTVTVGATANAGVVVGGSGVAGDGTISAVDLGGVAYQFDPVKGFNCYYHSVSSGPNLSDRLASSGRAAPMGIVAPLYGNGGYTKRQPFSGIKLAGGGNTWFRVLTAHTYSLNPKQQWGWAIAGRMRLEVTDGASNISAWEFDCNAILSGTFFPLNAPILTHKQGVQMSISASGLIQKARLSISPAFASPWCALDLFVANGSQDPTIMSGEFEGYGTINSSPTRGVATLETARLVSIGGSPQVGDAVSLKITPSGGALVDVPCTAGATPTPNSVAVCLVNAVNANGILSAAGITASNPALGSGSFYLNIPDPPPVTSAGATGGTTIVVGALATATLSFSNS
jgi:hypothetical protein